jgi:hypothetical protein
MEGNEYKVEKDRFSVTVSLVDGSTVEGWMYLSHHAAHHDGPETVPDLLNQDELFLPIHVEGQRTQLVNKGHIVMVSFVFDDKEWWTRSLENASIHEVVLQLTKHGRLEGRFISFLPRYARRVKDYLNQFEAFLELRKDGSRHLINKNHIVSVEERSEGNGG